MITQFRKHQKRVEKEASLSHQIEAAKSREMELAQRMKDEKRHRRYTMLSSLRTVNYEIKHAKVMSAKYPGTNEWIQSDTRYAGWLTSQASACLPCYGIPGSGKSILAASVIASLAEKLDTESALCYYYCDYTDSASLDSNYLMASLIKQILMRLPLESINDKLNCPFQEDMPPPSILASRDFLTRLFREFGTIYLVIDAIDELSPDNQRHVLDLIADLLSVPSPPIIKTFVTSRPEEHRVRAALANHESISLSTAEVNNDISQYIAGMISTMSQQNSLLKNETIKQEISSVLTAGAEGM